MLQRVLAPAGVSASSRHQRAADERGSAVLEAAIAIPVLIAVTLAMLWGLGLGITALALGDTARHAARALARGDSGDQVAAWIRAQAPAAEIEIRDEGGQVTVRLIQTVDGLGPVLDGLDATVTQSATAAKELRPW